MTSSTAKVQAGDDGPGFELVTRGLGFTWEGSGPRNADSPESAVAALSAYDIANRAQIERSSAPKVPGCALVVGPIARDPLGNAYVLCFSRFVAGATRQQPTRLVLTPVPVARGYTAESWRQAMVAEAKRHESGHGPVHFWHVKQVQTSQAVPNVLLQVFAADASGWAQALEYTMENGFPLDPSMEH